MKNIKISFRNFYIITGIVIALIVIFNPAEIFTNSLATAHHNRSYYLHRNIVYQTVNNTPLKLDVYQNKKPGLHPTLMVIHGGGWIKGSKEGEKYFFNPYLDWGFSVVNINYRLASVEPAPAAVEDALCALKWLNANSSKYSFDTQKVVLTGFSAGGHLSLTTGMMPNVDEFDRNCAGSQLQEVAAIVNWSGITDVNDLLVGKNQKYFALQWFDNKTSAREVELAKRVSPVNFVREDLPPIMTVHGEKDTFVPYNHAVRLHQELNKVGTVNQLYTVKGAAHGGFSKMQKKRIYAAIKLFLTKQGILSSVS